MHIITIVKNTFLKYIIPWVTVLVVIYLLFVGSSYLLLNQLMFHPPANRSSESFKKQLFSIEAGSEKISCIHLKAPGTSKTLLYSHGNAEGIGDRAWILSLYQKKGYSVLAYDYPGYGQSTGSPTETGVYAAADAAYLYLRDQCKLKPEDIIIYGRSIGSGPSHYLAEKYPVGGLIIECGFTSITRSVTRMKVIPFDAFPNIERISNIHCPVLYLHGEKDEVVPFSHGVEMYRRANDPKYKLWIPNCDHANIPQIAGELYWQTLQDFITHLDKKQPLEKEST